MALMTLSAAKAAVLTAVQPLEPVPLPVLEAHGHVLAEALVSTRALPACDVAAMDGYAVRAEDTRGANRLHPRPLRVVETVFAGQRSQRKLGPGEAVRLFTGAPLPPGADAVVRQEGTGPAGGDGGGEVAVVIEVPAGKDVRRTGEELGAGEPLLSRGGRLDAAGLGLLASQGWPQVRVYPAPRVAVLATGDELVSPGAAASPHQVYESNLALVSGLVREAGARVVATARCGDDDAALRAELSRLIGLADVVVTTGGASVGERDRVKQVLGGFGARLWVDGVAMKPGKPVAVGRLGACHLLVLPGNPGAAATAFDQLGRTLLFALQGTREVRRYQRVLLEDGQRKQPGFTYLLGARVERDGAGRLWARVRPRGGQLVTLGGREGHVILPAGTGDFTGGEEVELELFAGATFEPLPSG